MDSLRKLTIGELCEGTGKHGLVRDLRYRFPAAQSAQYRVDQKSIQQRPRVDDVENRLGQECSRNARPIMWWSARPGADRHEAVQLQRH